MSTMARAAATGLLQFRFPPPTLASCWSSSSASHLKLIGSSRPIQAAAERLRIRPSSTALKKKSEREVACHSSAGGAAGSVPVPAPEEPKEDGAWSQVLGRLKGSQAPPSISDIFWPSLGGFVAMAAMAYTDRILAPTGLSFTIGSFGAVCALLFAAPKSPVSQKYNVLVSHLGCAAVGVLALAVFGPGWIARAVALAAAIAFMQYTGSLHPPAAGLPLIMIDGHKLHHLQWWYVIYPGFVGCIFLFLLQEVVEYLRDKWKF